MVNVSEYIIDYTTLANLPRHERIERIYTQTPHSLSKVCFQCIELGKEVNTSTTDIVDDMTYAISFFAQKALE
jgi:hypothetical protein